MRTSSARPAAGPVSLGIVILAACVRLVGCAEVGPQASPDGDVAPAIDVAPATDDGPTSATVDAPARRDVLGRDLLVVTPDVVLPALDGGAPHEDAAPPPPPADAGASTDAPPDDARCAPYAISRRCADEHTLSICAAYEYAEAPTRVGCAPDERCETGRDDVAFCAHVDGCRTGSARCASPTTLERCVEGRPTVEACDGACVEGTLGASCVPRAASRTLAGTLRYHRRLPAADLLSWGDVVERPARGFAVHLRRGDAVMARAVTDDEGRFSMLVPAVTAPEDQLEAVAAAGETGHLTLAVADPALGPGAFSPERPPAAPTLWSWRWPAPPEGGATLSISLDDSPAAAVFDDLRAGLAAVRAHFAAPPRYDLVAWLGRGTEWTCGACFDDLGPEAALGQRFDAQLWISATEDAMYWSPAVALHEFGHYVMSAWGTPVWEGGAHYLGIATMPGQAWAEGWASWVGADLRDDPRLYSVSHGTFYWWDIGTRTYYRDYLWRRPDPSGSLLQRVDENEVSAILWALARPSAGAPGSRELYRSIAAPRMTASPFGRCYTRHVWYDTYYDYACTTERSTPHLADFLDAVRCGGAGGDVVRAAAGTYPYPSATPICEAGASTASCPAPREPSCGAYHLDAPLVARWVELPGGDPRLHRLLARVEYPGDLGAVATVSVETPPGATLRAGPATWTVAPRDRRDVEVDVEATQALGAPVTLRAEVHGAWAGARAAIPWSPAVTSQGAPPIVTRTR